MLAAVDNAAAFRSGPLSKNKARNHSQLGELLLMLVKEGITQTLVRITHDYSSLGLLNLGEAHLWIIGHVYIGVDAVGEGCSHHGYHMLRPVYALNKDARPLWYAQYMESFCKCE